jgi:outer membrane protein OmpA-like peptidoglycan-associated protein
MRTFIIGFVVFLLYAIPARWHYVCQIRNLCEDKPTETTAIASKIVSKIPNRTNDLMLKAGDSTLLTGYEQFGFSPNSAELQLTDNNNKYLSGMADYLKANPDARVSIIGNYFDDEKVTSGTYDNLGIARAAAIRDRLVSEYGFDTNRFKVDNKEIKKGNSDYLDVPIEYGIIVPKLNAKASGEVELAEASYTFERMTFSDINFEYNSAVFNPSKSFSVYADSVKQYLAANPKKALTIVGHADNRGSDETNRVLGLRRANNVIIYLRDKKGIDLKRMDSDSKGEKKPIVPNTNEANWRKNRRVEVIIK